jgi:hypothetical protein
MGHIPLAAKYIVSVAAAVAVVASAVIRPQQRLRSCGHPRDVLSEIGPVRASHCCRSGRTVNQLVNLYYAQLNYHDEHGTYAESLELITNEFPRLARDNTFYLDSDGSRWSIYVPKQAELAGSYLLTSVGRLHFCASGPATTNDTVLRDMTK